MIFNKSSLFVCIFLMLFVNIFAFDSQGGRTPQDTFQKEEMRKPMTGSGFVEQKPEQEVFIELEPRDSVAEEIVEKKRLFTKKSKRVNGEGIPLKGNTAMLIAIIPNLIFLLALITSFPALMILSAVLTIISLIYSIKLIKFYKNNRDYPNSREELLKGRLSVLFATLWIWFMLILFVVFILLWGW